jgi:hypothetical protein
MAQLGANGESLPITVRETLEASLQGQFAALGRLQRAYLEDVIRTHAYTIVFALAPVSIDARDELAGFLLAVGIGRHASGDAQSVQIF